MTAEVFDLTTRRQLISRRATVIYEATGSEYSSTFSITIVHDPCVGRCKRSRGNLAVAQLEFPGSVRVVALAL